MKGQTTARSLHGEAVIALDDLTRTAAWLWLNLVPLHQGLSESTVQYVCTYASQGLRVEKAGERTDFQGFNSNTSSSSPRPCLAADSHGIHLCRQNPEAILMLLTLSQFPGGPNITKRVVLC